MAVGGSALRKMDRGLQQVMQWKVVNGEGSAPPPDGDLSAELTGATSAPLRSSGGRRVKLLWASQLIGTGFAYGYATHANNMRKALAAAGVEISYDRNADCDIAVSIVPPELFDPVPGRFNLLFSTAEMSEPTEPLKAMPSALVVPCEYSKKVFAKFYPGDIHVCPEGVDVEAFPFFQRKEPGPGDRFRFLFNGNIRDSTKGFGLAISAWRAWLTSGRAPAGTQFYVKTTGLPGPELSFYPAVNGNLVGPFPLPPEVSLDLPEIAMVVDNRNLPVRELAALYNSSHALLAPSLGEAWNLVLTEAMATGMPCAWTHATSTLDYADTSTGWPITAFKPCIFRQDMPGYYGFAAEESAIINAMQEIVDDYPAALARGRAASERMKKYSWRAAAEKFVHICRRYI